MYIYIYIYICLYIYIYILYIYIYIYTHTHTYYMNMLCVYVSRNLGIRPKAILAFEGCVCIYIYIYIYTYVIYIYIYVYAYIHVYIIAFLPDRDVLGFPALGFLVAWLPTAYVNCPYHVYIYIYMNTYIYIYIYIYYCVAFPCLDEHDEQLTASKMIIETHSAAREQGWS